MMIRAENIHKSFKDNQVLKGVSLGVQKGDVAVIIGPSGSGKTTLLRCINYLERPDQGSVTIDGFTLSGGRHISSHDILKLRRKSAMVFQHYNLFQNKTALGNVMEGPMAAQKMKKKDAADMGRFLLKKVGLEDKIDAYPSQLSGGQQQRVGIARALALNPRVILFDEPTSALDPELVGEVLLTIRQVAREGMTMIVVTHEMNFAREIASRIFFMDAGLIVEEGPPGEIFGNAAQERTKQFLRRFAAEPEYSL